MLASRLNNSDCLRSLAGLLALGAGLGCAAPALAGSQDSDVASGAATAQILLPAPQGAGGEAVDLNPSAQPVRLTVAAMDGVALLGEVPVVVDPDDRIRVPARRLLDLLVPLMANDRYEAIEASLATRREVPLSILEESGIGLRFDPQRLELQVTIPSGLRAGRRLQVAALDRARIGEFAQPEKFSAYLNVRGALDYISDGPDDGFREPTFFLDGASRMGDIVLEGEAFWQPGGNGTDFRRQGTRLVYDDQQRVARWTLGDLEPVGRAFQVAPNMAGLSIERSYSALRPQQIIRPRGGRSFLLERSSTVEVYVNGSLARRVRLDPGNYNLDDFPYTQGANDIRVAIIDDSGREETLRFNVFLDQTQLAEGLTEFGAYLGVSAPFGASGPDYSDDPVFTGFMRHGVSDTLTLGGNLQVDSRTAMGGVEAVMGTSFGTFSGNLSASTVDGLGEGVAATVSFQRLFQRSSGFSDLLNIFAETRSEKFAPIGLFGPPNPYEFELGGGYSHAIDAAAYVGFDARYSKGRGPVEDQHSYRVSSGYRVNDRVTLTGETRYEKNTFRDEISAFFGINVRFGGFSSGRVQYDTRDNRARASWQTLQGSGVGSYNLSADIERSDFGSGVSLAGNYYSNVGEFGLSHFGDFSRDFGSSRTQRTTLRMASSFAVAGDAFAIGRPIYDSFAIVQPHATLRNTGIIVDPAPGGYVASTEPLGGGVHPSLNSYSERTITIEAPEAEAGADLGTGSFRVLPPYRSGYKLTVGSDYHLTAIGTLVGPDGNPVSLAAGTIAEMGKADGVRHDIFTNRQGRFGIPNLAPGKWQITMSDDFGSEATIEIPAKPDGNIIRLGTVQAQERQ